MNAAMRLEQVSCRQIDFEDREFSLKLHTGEENQSQPENTLPGIGIIHPPVLKKKSTLSYQVVTGLHRLQALIEQTPEAVKQNCLVLPVETAPEECLTFALKDSLQERSLSIVGKGIFFRKILKHIDKEKAAETFLPLMGLANHPYHIDNILQLLELEEPLTQAIDEGRLDEGAARALLRFSFSDRLAIFEVVSTLRLSVGYQKKLIALCREIASRQGIFIRDLLTRPEVEKIRNHSEANVPQKVANLMAHLYTLCYPRLTKAKSQFDSYGRSLNLPRNVKITPSQSFEKDTITMTIEFGSQESLTAAWPAIADALKNI